MDPKFPNRTALLVCQDPHSHERDIWHLGNPLYSPTSLLLMQISLIAIVSQCIDLCLKPLGQSSLVSQILGGMLFGPSGLGREKVLRDTLFPMRGALVFETIASFGLMFVFFIMSVKMDPATLVKTEKQALTIGLSVFSLTITIPTGLSFLLKKYVSMDKGLRDSITFIAISQALTVFICIQILLNELKILNTDTGRLALNSALSADVIGFSMTLVMFSIMQNEGGKFSSLLLIILAVVALFLLIVYVMRPLILWFLKRSTGNPLDEFVIIGILIFLLIVGFLSEIVGQHFLMGPIILGLAIPEGPPLGTALLTKLQTLCMGFLYPMYLAVCGLQTNIFQINFQSLWIVSIIVITSCAVKIGAVMLAGYYNNIPMKDCCVMGLILNARGVPELCMFNVWKASKILTEKEFTLMVVSILVTNAILAPLLRFIYDPAQQYHSMRRCSIQHTKQDSELRVMACILNNESIPTIINLLEASYASIESTVVIIALSLIELRGRARPLLVAHQPHDTLRSASCNSTQIENALRQYAQHNEGCASVYSFTSMSEYDTMHGDVCRISHEMGANILIMPFHKRWEIDGSVQVISRSIQTMNIRVLERAPCSVGILIDRGILSGFPSLLVGRVEYNIAVLFIGGADDAEALAYGTRMARHACIRVTVIRFLLFGEENSKDRKRDTDLIDEYRYFSAANHQFDMMDQIVRDGIEMSTCIRRLIDYFDLVIVGKDHPNSIMLQGHDQWSECKELGIIGDMLASKDFVTKASVLVVQQQRIRKRLIKHIVTPLTNHRDQSIHNIPTDAGPRPSIAISM
ncbi:hypothetical protein TanjilG_16744 [Lupinus angustifolius]|uniref:Uncharacterized protein n=1 Tax=Lupinus angustifolius TaxID=3871 RepID=A0A4P1QZK4_LUPAN|nr:PREDICTED: cation/H(+) antiporter 15-like [Lupinus angustifolius]OIV98417.1 hypothetical protein TanjilG_16744 [Lupinus angustifolius]